MTTPATRSDLQFIRQCGLVVFSNDQTITGGQVGLVPVPQRGIDLSEMRIDFQVRNADSQSPNNAAIRVWNLSQDTIKALRAIESARVTLRAGYDSNSGVIFEGDVKQYLIGRASPTETFLVIMAADGDIGFNYGTVGVSIPAGSNAKDSFLVAARGMGVNVDESRLPDLAGTSPRLARGKVGYGMARDLARDAAATINSDWSIQNGALQVIERPGYLPGEAVVLNAATGMIGIPQQTDEGINVRCLLNPKIVVGATVRLNNASITRLVQADKAEYGVPFNSWAGIQFAAKIADGADGLYRVYVAEHAGDTRGEQWYTDLVCLAVAQAQKRVEAP